MFPKKLANVGLYSEYADYGYAFLELIINARPKPKSSTVQTSTRGKLLSELEKYEYRT